MRLIVKILKKKANQKWNLISHWISLNSSLTVTRKKFSDIPRSFILVRKWFIDFLYRLKVFFSRCVNVGQRFSLTFSHTPWKKITALLRLHYRSTVEDIFFSFFFFLQIFMEEKARDTWTGYYFSASVHGGSFE